MPLIGFPVHAGSACSSKRSVKSAASGFVSRRDALLATSSAVIGAAVPAEAATEYRDAVSTAQPLRPSPEAVNAVNSNASTAASTAFNLPDYTAQGPLTVQRLPKLEHTCIRCFPACQINKCLLRVDVWYPKGGPAIGQAPPYPLAIFSSGFLVASELYQSYARRLTSWGYTVMLYDKMETAVDPVDDELSASFLTELIDWAGSDPILKQVADPRRVYLIGHSRGAKIATLAAAKDTRVAAVCLVDPVDNTVYAPLGPGFPSAAAALRNLPESRSLPVAIVGGGIGGDCAPEGSNHNRFYSAAPGAAWEVVIADCGHFQFLDKQSLVQQAICGQGLAPDSTVRNITHSVMVAWGELATKTSLFSSASSAATANFSTGVTSRASNSLSQVSSGSSSRAGTGRADVRSCTLETQNRAVGVGVEIDSREGFTSRISRGSGDDGAVLMGGDSSTGYNRNSSVSGGGGGGAGRGVAQPLGEWVSASSSSIQTVQGNNAKGSSVGGGEAGLGGGARSGGSGLDKPVQNGGVAGAWHEVTRGVSAQAEEILRQAGPGPAGRPLEVRYRMKEP